MKKNISFKDQAVIIDSLYKESKNPFSNQSDFNEDYGENHSDIDRIIDEYYSDISSINPISNDFD